MPLIGYARVSTEDQTPLPQSQALKAAGCAEIHEEQASGGDRARPVLARLLDEMRKGDTLVVVRIDRLARSLDQLIKTVEDLKTRGIDLKSLTESIDTSTPGGMLIFHIFGSIAQFERSIIRERSKAGVAAAKARGRHGGRPAKLAGERAEHAANLLAAGTSVSAVARSMGVSRSTVLRSIRMLQK